MNIVSQLMVTTSSTMVVLALAGQSAFGLDIHRNLKTIDTNSSSSLSSTILIQKSSLISGANRIMEVQDSVISAPIPQPLTLGFFMVMGGLGGFFKLKIAQAKIQQSSEES